MGQKPLIRSFVSYCHTDRELVEDLLERLRLRLNLSSEFEFESWSDRHILTGEEWRREIEQAMKRSELGLLFVSYPFLNSAFIVDEEVPVFLEANGKRPIPVGLSRVPFDGSVTLQGLEERQFYRDPKGRYYDELQAAERNAFVQGLFEEILRISRKYFSGPEVAR